MRKYHEKAVVGTRVRGTCYVAATLDTLAGSLRLLSLLRNCKSRGKGKRQRWRRRGVLAALTKDARRKPSAIREKNDARGDESRGTDPLPLPSRGIFFFFAAERIDQSLLSAPLREKAFAPPSPSSTSIEQVPFALL